MRALVPLLLLTACDRADGDLGGGWTVTWRDDEAAFDLAGPQGQRLDAVKVELLHGTQTILNNAGAFRFEDVTEVAQRVVAFAPVDGDAAARTLVGEDGAEGVLRLEVDDAGTLRVSLTGVPEVQDTRRLRLSAACEPDDHFLGLGSHAMDVDHVGEAFPLWTSEPGIGKSTTDDPGDDWFLVGTKHATSFPVPFLLRPQQPLGLRFDTVARVEVDLCATDPARFSVEAWDDELVLDLIPGARPLEVVERLSAITGRPRRLPRWALAPWNDAVRGPDRVREVAAKLREAGAPSSVIWTEDWKGGTATSTGYRLKEQWEVDRGLYPDIEDLADELAADGFQWLAYFAPFLGLEDASGQDAVAQGAVIRDAAGETASFLGVTFRPTTLVDPFSADGIAWAQARMQAVVDLGFRGWMADYGEWLPADAIVGDDDRVGLDVHNDYPRAWLQLNEEVLAPVDGVPFCRSGWGNTSGTCPVVWVGDQRTSFQTDDGLPSVLPLVLGLSTSGVPVATHDVAGYQSLTNPTTTKELWFRWAALGAFSPILRTHHGSSADANHQFDSDAETLAFWARMATEHMRLFPYRDGLAAQASEQGTPMVLPTSFVFDGEPWDRVDAWMLGRSLLVAPVLQEGATSRQVDLPAGTDWFDWWTLAPATSGVVDAPIDGLPVYVAAGTTVPLFDLVPDTLAPTTDPELVDFDAADATRLVLLVGGGGPFTEGDGTTYTPSGTPTGPGETTVTLTSGAAEVAGVTVQIDGPKARTYRLRVVVP